MDLYAPSKEKALHVDLPTLIDLYPDEPIKSIAVLFTDLVGSTKYFKRYGDKAGRTMLQEHYEIATPIINEYGGKLIKALGDSVMASFISPLEAFKSAIKMQQQFCIYNNEKSTQDQIYVRIGIHYGNVIVEEKDIYGDVVNVASKLTNMSDGGQIYVSREVYELTKHTPLINFELVNSWNKTNMPNGLIAYKVIWNTAVELNPAMDTMLYLRPIWKLCESDFNEIWDGLLVAKDIFWKREGKKEQVFSDKSLLLTMKESSFAFIVAEKILKFLREELLHKNEDDFIPVQIIIDTSSFFTEDKQMNQCVDGNWEDINPGEIYISSDAYELIKKYMDIPTTSILKGLLNRAFYKVLPDEKVRKDHSSLFLYKQKIIMGEFSPCYYCGAKSHRPTDCPSKTLPEITHALEGLGYLSIEEINELFLKYLLTEGVALDIPILSGDKHSNKSIATVHLGLFELKRVFQLRFFRTIWDSTAEEWNKIRESKGESDGGMAWLAQDSLRVSDLNRAASILHNALKGNPADYRIYCALGYLNMERDNLLQAEHYFNEALLYVSSNAQKIFLLLLLSRLYMLNNDYSNAQKRIKNILLLNPGCIDAVYQDIVLKFYEEKDKSAVQRLIKLIKDNRVYFIYVLLDPDLAPYSDIINPQLLMLYNTAKANAKSIFREAEEEINNSKKILDMYGITETQSLLLKTRNMFESDSYFSYLDIIFYCNSIISICKNRIKERKKTLSERLHQLNGQIEKYMNFVKRYHYPRLTNPYRKQLVHARGKIDQAQDDIKLAPGEQIGTFETFCEVLSAELNDLEINLKKLDIFQQFLINFSRFLKKSAILLSMVLLIGIFAIPAIIPAIPRIDITGANSIWFYQKSFLIVGSITSIGISLLLTIKKIIHDD
ncbi:MAG: adenylate/guanylate cyclase domain-containing protein [Proteobacteria bacterium]|nr:adenylate/guanylate cyclase domain-containing protein [Pseudomonadota bacterium]